MTRKHIQTLLLGLLAGAIAGVVITYFTDGALFANLKHVTGYAGIGGLAAHLVGMRARRAMRKADSASPEPTLPAPRE